MVKLRLRRMGKKRKPIYKIVAADSRSPRDGRFIESVGFYNPNIDPMEVKLDEQKVNRWLNNGAQPTETVKSLLKREGIIFKRHLSKKGLDTTVLEEKMNTFFESKNSKLETEKAKKLRRKERKANKKKETENK
ncbi:MAG TPA: 30S ribosomal protein S16, partial [Ignavibacteria bacterium]